jgi:nucleotide-binding universal stress UspA family protein
MYLCTTESGAADRGQGFMIRKLLLPMSSTPAAEAALATALSIARPWDAHVAALHVGSDTRRESATRSIFERCCAEHDTRVGEAKPNDAAPSASFAAVAGRESEVIAQQARLADLIVVAHPGDTEDVSSSETLHAVLFESARPVLIAPAAPPASVGKRVCVGWNGSAESASAVLAALPWLQRAEAVRILWSEEYQRRGPASLDLESYLAAHDVHAERKRFQSANGVVGAGLLAAAYDFGCDLLAMGAYSQSRLRQMILGGVTRHVLERAAIPVMMHR